MCRACPAAPEIGRSEAIEENTAGRTTLEDLTAAQTSRMPIAISEGLNAEAVCMARRGAGSGHATPVLRAAASLPISRAVNRRPIATSAARRPTPNAGRPRGRALGRGLAATTCGMGGP